MAKPLRPHKLRQHLVNHYDKLKELKFMGDTTTLCAVLGLIIGILLAAEFRLRGTCDDRLKAVGLGILLGAIVGLAFVDILGIISKKS